MEMEMSKQAENTKPRGGKHDPRREMIGFKHVLAMIPVSTATIMRWVEAGEFPKPRRVGLRRWMWLRHEVEAWQDRLPDDAPSRLRTGDGKTARQNMPSRWDKKVVPNVRRRRGA